MHSQHHRPSSLHEPSTNRAFRFEYQLQETSVWPPASEAFHPSIAQLRQTHLVLSNRSTNLLCGPPRLQPVALLRPTLLEYCPTQQLSAQCPSTATEPHQTPVQLAACSGHHCCPVSRLPASSPGSCLSLEMRPDRSPQLPSRRYL